MLNEYLKSNIFKSEINRIIIPECNLKNSEGSISRKFTRIESFSDDILKNFTREKSNFSDLIIYNNYIWAYFNFIILN